MNKEYFQDIVTHDKKEDFQPPAEEPRGIRTIEINRRAPRRDVNPPVSSPRRRRNSFITWLVVALALILIAIVLLLVFFRATTVTVVPRAQQLSIDPSVHFTAYPTTGAATGTLSYTVSSIDMDDSTLIAHTTGTTQTGTTPATTSLTSSRVSGSLMVYNEYSNTSVRLIKNTRFASADGHIFRVPADVVVPGKSGGNAGSVSVTVIADKPGSDYAVAVGRFTIPGLKSNPAMFAKVYARSAAQFVSGSTGGVASSGGSASGGSARDTAIADIRSRIESKVRAQAASQTPSGMSVLPDLIQITYQDMPDTTESDGVHVHEHAHAVVPQFPAAILAQTVAQPVISDASSANVSLVGGRDLSAHLLVDESGSVSSPNLGTDPILFTLSGSAAVVWNIDTRALTAALAGRDTNSFTSIVANFPAIQKANARIEPFWQHTFPSDPSQIKIIVVQPVQV